MDEPRSKPALPSNISISRWRNKDTLQEKALAANERNQIDNEDDKEFNPKTPAKQHTI